MLFWIITGVLAIVAAALLARALVQSRAGAEPPAAYDLRVYRDQLKEVDKDLARGVINAEDAERTKAEISRRILTADAQIKAGGDTGGQPQGLGRGMALALSVALIAGSLGLYWKLGAPGYADLGLATRIEMAKELHATRPSQAEMEAQLPATPAMGEVSPEYRELVEKLRKAVADRPNEIQGYMLLARNEAALGNFTAAHEAQARVLELKGDTATARDHVDYADLLILATNGYVSPQAEKALLDALALEPRDASARYYMGLMLAQTGRPDRAFRTWDALLREGPANAPWIAPIRAQIEEIAALAGIVNYTPPSAAPAMPGPSSEDMQAAQDMTPEERMEMIQGMVAQLSDRLANEGGTPEEWARLIAAYGVLGEAERASAIWTEAQQVFKDRPEALATIRAGAERAGLE
jgi:cytochrome c-type biogenesis protein CcmH